jgi:hypothetical protein
MKSVVTFVYTVLFQNPNNCWLWKGRNFARLLTLQTHTNNKIKYSVLVRVDRCLFQSVSQSATSDYCGDGIWWSFGVTIDCTSLKKMFLFQVTVCGHHFVAHQYFTVTYCNHCQLIIWGIGPQGYQCSGMCSAVSLWWGPVCNKRLVQLVCCCSA